MAQLPIAQVAASEDLLVVHYSGSAGIRRMSTILMILIGILLLLNMSIMILLEG